MICFYCDSEINDNSTYCKYCGMETTEYFDINKIKVKDSIAKEILYYYMRTCNGSMRFWEDCLKKNSKDIKSLENLFSTYTGVLNMIDGNIYNFILSIPRFNKSIPEYKKEMKIGIEILNLFKKMITKNLNKYIKYQNSFLNNPTSLNELQNLSDSLLRKIDIYKNLLLNCSNKKPDISTIQSLILITEKQISAMKNANTVNFNSQIETFQNNTKEKEDEKIEEKITKVFADNKNEPIETNPINESSETSVNTQTTKDKSSLAENTENRKNINKNYDDNNLLEVFCITILGAISLLIIICYLIVCISRIF